MKYSKPIRRLSSASSIAILSGALFSCNSKSTEPSVSESSSAEVAKTEVANTQGLPEIISFNDHVRPILNKNCTACHGGVKKAGGISYLFRNEALVKGDSGKFAITPGSPKLSHMLDRILDKKDPMPPADHGHTLDEKQVAILTKWIEQGASWDDHWAFVAPKPQEIPTLEDNKWAQTPIDTFILQKMQERGFTPNPDADKHSVLRRMSLDLIGLAPSEAEYAKFKKLPYEAFVDHLLASPHFGERWATLWMDLARYADSMGYERDPYREMWPYRDWLIRSFNEDKPYNTFVTEQLAGDLLPNPSMDQLIATGFMRNSQSNTEGGTDDEEFRVASVIERVNTTWESIQSVSFGCVQCHTHPYDPIKHDEYYAFKGFFENAADNDDRNDYPKLLVPNKRSDFSKAASLQLKLNALEEQFAKVSEEQNKLTSWQAVKVRKSATTGSGTIDPDKKFPGYLKANGTIPYNATYTVDFTPTSNKPVSALKVEVKPDEDGKPSLGYIIKNLSLFLVNSEGKRQKIVLNQAFSDFQRSGVDLNSVFHNNNQGWWNSTKIFRSHWLTVLPAQAINVPEGSHLELKLKHHEAYEAKVVIDRFKVETTTGDAWRKFTNSNKVATLLQDLGKTRKSIRAIRGVRMPFMQELRKQDKRKNYTFVRGNWLDLGKEIEPGVPATFNPGLGKSRLDMARWIVDEKNPLAARVIVNRLWSELYGIGIVRTLGDFGTQGAKPTHPELLDYLATELMHKHDWKLKPLLKRMVLARTYQQSPKATKQDHRKDPYNQYYARGSRSRLSAEMIRDQALQIAGLLSSKQFGKPVKPHQPNGIWRGIGGGAWHKSKGEDQYRRALYTHWRRTRPYPSTIVFDAPSREICNFQRHTTNTPLHALVTLNDPVYAECATILAQRALGKPQKKPLNPDWKSGEITGKTFKKASVDLTGKKLLILTVGDFNGQNGSDHANWIQPILTGPKGKLPLTKLKWTKASTGYAEVRIGKNTSNKPIVWNGKQQPNSIGTHAKSTIIYRIPDGYDTFQTTVALAASANGAGSVDFSITALAEDNTPMPEVTPSDIDKIYHIATGKPPEAYIKAELWNLYQHLLDGKTDNESINKAVTGVASAVLNLDEVLTK